MTPERDAPQTPAHDTIWWPISATHVCASVGPRGIIHAVTMVAALAARTNGGQHAITVCGVHRNLLAHRTIDHSNGRDGLTIATWPPPIIDRCTDCAQRLGTRNTATGSRHWQQLVDTPETGP